MNIHQRPRSTARGRAYHSMPPTRTEHTLFIYLDAKKHDHHTTHNSDEPSQNWSSKLFYLYMSLPLPVCLFLGLTPWICPRQSLLVLSVNFAFDQFVIHYWPFLIYLFAVTLQLLHSLLPSLLVTRSDVIFVKVYWFLPILSYFLTSMLSGL